MSVLVDFHVFSSLPPEIRCAIWSLCLPGPRIHHISRPTANQPAVSSCPPLLNLLLTSRESHGEVLHHLKRLLLPSHEGPCDPAPAINPTWRGAQHPQCCSSVLVNPLIDVIYLSGRHVHNLGYEAWLSRPAVDFSIIRSLAVDCGLSAQGTTGRNERIHIVELVRRMGHVHHLYIVDPHSQFVPVQSSYDFSSWGVAQPNPDQGWSWVNVVNRRVWQSMFLPAGKENAVLSALERERENQAEPQSWPIPTVELKYFIFEKRNPQPRTAKTTATLDYFARNRPGSWPAQQQPITPLPPSTRVISDFPDEFRSRWSKFQGFISRKMASKRPAKRRSEMFHGL